MNRSPSSAVAPDDRRTPRVLVVGAGPTGLVAALLLADLGVASTVVDRRCSPHRLPRAVHLDDECVRILQSAGVAEGFAAISRAAAGLRLLDGRLRPFAVFTRDGVAGRHGWPESNVFDQPELEELLLAEAARRPLVTVRSGTELVDVFPAGRVTVRDIADGSLDHLEFDAVLGCDGAGSTVRTTLGSRSRDLGFTERWFVVDVRCARRIATWGGVDQICDPRRPATFLALPADRYRWEFRMDRDETADDLVARIDSLTAPWRPDVATDDLEVLRAAEYVFRARIATRWREGRVLLLGDAAHLTPPFIGQGLCAGLRDAHNLAWKLAAVLGGADDDVLLDSYQAERAPHAEAVIRGAVRVGRAMTGGQDIAAALRRPATGLLLRVPGVRAAAQRGIATRYAPGPLVDRRRHRRDLSGTHCPQPTVLVDGHASRLDDVLGDGYTLLAAGPVPPALRARAQGLRAPVLQLRPTPEAAGRVHDYGQLDDGGHLRAWLAGGRACAALLRPDRIVLATAPQSH